MTHPKMRVIKNKGGGGQNLNVGSEMMLLLGCVVKSKVQKKRRTKQLKQCESAAQTVSH